MRVWTCERWTASPKQPQSIIGLKITRSMVINVKNAVSAIVSIAVALRATPAISMKPQTVSTNAIKVPNGFESTSRKETWKKLKYSFTTSPAPTGS